MQYLYDNKFSDKHFTTWLYLAVKNKSHEAIHYLIYETEYKNINQDSVKTLNIENDILTKMYYHIKTRNKILFLQNCIKKTEKNNPQQI